MICIGAHRGAYFANFIPEASLGLLAKVSAIAVIVLAMWSPASIRAQTFTWSGATNDYNLGSNWTPSAGAPPVNAGQAAVFSSGGNASVNVSAGPITPDSWTFGATSQSYTISGQDVNFNGTVGVKLANNANAGQTITISNNMTGSALYQSGASTLVLSGANNFASSIIFDGTLALTGGGKLTGSVLLGAGTFDISGTTAGATIVDFGGDSGSHVMLGAQTLTISHATGIFSGIIQGTGGGLALQSGIETLKDVNTYTGATTITGGTLALSGTGSIAASSLVTVSTGGAATLDISSTSGTSLVGLAGAASGAVTLGNQTLTITNASSANQFYGAINGTGGLTIAGGAQVLGGINGYTGVTTINSGTTLGILGSGSIANSVEVIDNGSLDISVTNTGTSIAALGGWNTAATVQLGSKTLTITAGSGDFGGTIHGTGGLILNSGLEVLTGISDYTGPTTVNSSGSLVVNGSILSAVTVNGGMLAGTGQVGATQINSGGVLLPGVAAGTSMTLSSLAFQSAAFYSVYVSPATSSSANVTGSATLGGATVIANFSSGSYVAKTYTIMNAGSISGTFNPTVDALNLPSGFKTSLSYDPSHVYLDLALSFTPPGTPSFGGGLNANQQNVANTLTNFFNTTGGIPLVFGTLTPSGLTQAAGESATGSQQTTFNAMGQFMGVMTDPFLAGRGDSATPGGIPNAYAEESLGYAAQGRSQSEPDAYAAVYTKAPPVAPFGQRWSVWAAGFGGSQKTNGDPAALGSNDSRSSIYGTAVGADYRFSPDTIAGFALAGGGTNFSVNGLGSGRSDLFQAGGFVRHNMGAAYISGALAYGWQDITTDRVVSVAGLDHLRAEFDANAWSGRVEGGYRFVTGGLGITPYAAGQFTNFDLPSYAEQAIVGTPMLALAYGSKSVTDSRSELGFRSDKSFATQDGVLTLRGRLAWAHDFDPDRSLLATFQTLPGASFVVNGARQDADSALTTASAEMKWTNGWSAAATFEGEFSNVTRSYAGKGVVRYAW